MNTNKKSTQKYNAIIIGAGIAGLICANYLAKKGSKILLIEKTQKAGGCCTSFKREDFIFDSCVHSIGSCRKRGIITNILKELGIKQDKIFVKCNPSDLMIIGNDEYFFYKNVNKTLSALQTRFPREKYALKAFFSIITETRHISLCLSLRNYISYKQLLDDFFKDYRLKGIFKFFLGNIGLPSYKVSPLTAMTLLREHVFDGGYYPKGGMRGFSELLLKNFIKNKGHVLFDTKAEKIIVKNKQVRGVLTNRISLTSKYIISACDMNQTLYELIGKENINTKMLKRFSTMKPSVSGFIMYIGLNSHVDKYFRGTKANIWYCKNYNIDNEYENVINIDFYKQGTSIFCSSPSLKDNSLAPKNKASLELMILAPYISKKYWIENIEKIKLAVLKRALNVMPELGEKIEIIDFATPITLEKYTANYHGALYGWASIPSQTGINRLPIEKLDIKNIFFTGHWVGLPVGYGGIVNVAYSAKNTAGQIIKTG